MLDDDWSLLLFFFFPLPLFFVFLSFFFLSEEPLPAAAGVFLCGVMVSTVLGKGGSFALRVLLCLVVSDETGRELNRS